MFGCLKGVTYGNGDFFCQVISIVSIQWRIQKYNNAIIPGDLVQHENEVIVSSTPDSIENVVLPLLG